MGLWTLLSKSNTVIITARYSTQNAGRASPIWNDFNDRNIFIDSGISPCVTDLKYDFLNRKYTSLAGWAGVEMTWYLPSTAYLKTGT